MKWYLNVLKKYAVFSGRAQREEFWYFILFDILIALILRVFDVILGTLDAQNGGFGLLGILYGLAVFMPSLAVSVRRLHDIGKSGWWQLIVLIPLIGAILLIVWFATDSKENNQYGGNPKKNDGTDIFIVNNNLTSKKRTNIFYLFDYNNEPSLLLVTIFWPSFFIFLIILEQNGFF